MHFTATADTDIGISKAVNQDSLLIKHASWSGGEVLLAVVCDGMGGLSMGETASATVIRAFASWFDNDLPYELEAPDLSVIGARWSHMLKDLNRKLLNYTQSRGLPKMGTTFTGILFLDSDYVIAHVGDSRIYQLGADITQVTEDQTFVAREIRRGNMTPEQAKTDKRRNLLLQCVGANENVEPQLLFGKAEKGAYLLCSDGFRHEISGAEMLQALAPAKLSNPKVMHRQTQGLIDTVKRRKEKDNISAILIKAE